MAIMPNAGRAADPSQEWSSPRGQNHLQGPGYEMVQRPRQRPRLQPGAPTVQRQDTNNPAPYYSQQALNSGLFAAIQSGVKGGQSPEDSAPLF